MSDPGKITVKQAAKMVNLPEENVRNWFLENNLRIWKRDKVLLTDVVLFQAEIRAVEASLDEISRLGYGLDEASWF